MAHKYGNIIWSPPSPDFSSPWPLISLLTLILWTRGANRNTKSSTVAMEFWKIFLQVIFFLTGWEVLWQGCPENWFSTWWMSHWLPPPQLEPRLCPQTLHCCQQSCGAPGDPMQGIRSFVSAHLLIRCPHSTTTAQVKADSVTRTMMVSLASGKNILALRFCGLISWETLWLSASTYSHC